MASRWRVLQIGPDVRGGMRTATRELLDSPLAEDYELQFVVTHRGSGKVRRLAVYLGALARLTLWSLAGRGRIVHVHGTVRGSMYRKAVCVLLAKALRRRVVFHIHSSPGDVAVFCGGLNRSSLALMRFAYRRADVVLAVSVSSAASLEEAFGVDGVVVLPNIVPAISERPREPRPGADVTVAYLGGFANRIKGGEILLEALERPEATALRAVLAGPGELPTRGRALVAGRAGVEWRGWLEGDEKDALLRAADVFVLPAISEGLPMALLEAMAYGLAIVATEVGGVPDVVSDGLQGLLVPPRDPAALAAALGRIGEDAAMRARLGAAAKERSEAFSPTAVAEQLGAIYRSLA
jgi:glycosyltransferase involved in cell wall biosynthesis